MPIDRIPNPASASARAACRDADPETFFAIGDTWDLTVPENAARYRAAKAVCARCPLRPECREYAIAVGDPAAILGGLTPVEASLHRADRARIAAAYAEACTA